MKIGADGLIEGWEPPPSTRIGGPGSRNHEPPIPASAGDKREPRPQEDDH